MIKIALFINAKVSRNYAVEGKYDLVDDLDGFQIRTQ